MRSINISDAEAVRSALNRDGVAGAIAEIKRRWPGIGDDKAKDALEIILDMTMNQHNSSERTPIIRDIAAGRRNPRW